MADITVTAADVRPLPGAIVQRFIAGSTITPGQAVFMGTDGQLDPADADADASARIIGIVVAGAQGKVSFAAGDTVDVVCVGPVAGFSSLTPGTLLYASTTAGAIADARPAGSSGDYAHIVGWAKDAVTIFVNPFTDIFTAL